MQACKQKVPFLSNPAQFSEKSLQWRQIQQKRPLDPQLLVAPNSFFHDDSTWSFLVQSSQKKGFNKVSIILKDSKP